MSSGGLGWLPPRERHRGGRSGRLRAAVLGADDGIVSIASLPVGVAAANASRAAVITAGAAGLVAGAMSMAAGEYVSVSSQRDADGDLAKETEELATSPDAELDESTQIYLDRGLSVSTAWQVAVELTARDALTAHARDELGLIETLRARPLQAATYSAVSFVVGRCCGGGGAARPDRHPDRGRHRCGALGLLRPEKIGPPAARQHRRDNRRVREVSDVRSG